MTATPVRVPLGEVRDLISLSQPLPFRVLDVQARLLLGKGQRIMSESQLEMLLERGAWVEQDQVVAVRRERDSAGAAGKVPSTRQLTLFDLWEKEVWDFDALQRRIGKFRDLRTDIEAFTDRFIGLVARDPDVALFTAVRQDDRRFALYALTHSLHVAVLCMLTGQLLRWDGSRIATICRAALTMNVSTIELQATLAEQATPPTNRQREQIRSHPQRSVQMLRDSGIDDSEWLDTVDKHHERPDGSGYPGGITDVSDLVRVLHAADVYMAKISPRALRPALPPQTAARELFQQDKGSPIAAAMVRAVGIFPPGDVVVLRSGEIAVVTRRAEKGPAPLAASISNRQGMPTLETTRRNTADAEFAIVAPAGAELIASLPRLLPERFYGLIPGSPDGTGTP